MKKLFILWLCLVITNTLSAQDKTEDMVLKLDRQRFDAQISKDTTLLNQLLSNDLIYVHSSGLVENKKEYVDKISNRQADYREVNIEKAKAHIYGKNTAIINGTAKINLWQTDKMVTIYLHYLDVWVKEKGKWRMVRWQSTRINP